jgi:hypothetical protein
MPQRTHSAPWVEMNLASLFIVVIAGLDPAIPLRKVDAKLIGMAGSSPAMT